MNILPTGLLLTIACIDSIKNNRGQETRSAWQKSVTGSVSSVPLGSRVCLLFQKVSLQNRSYLFKKKKNIVVKSRKKMYSTIIFSALKSYFV